jgi:hypothetical protein
VLNVQKFLIDNHRQNEPGYNFQLLTEQVGIKCNYHPKYPLVILNYDQIESPKMDPIVRECRGLVLDTSNYDIVAGCMPRFFNLGEALEITDKFDWNSPINSRSKEDGSLMSLFNYKGCWMVKTRDSWADKTICENSPTWEYLFTSLLPHGFISKECNPNTSYIFEMCSMYNQVVRQYSEPKLFLLTTIKNNGEEYHYSVTDQVAEWYGLNRPTKIDVTNEYAVREYITTLEQTDGTAEGLVLQDKNGLRIKVKSSTYLACSRLGGNGNLAIDKNLIPLILANEQDEAIAIFPQIEERVKELVDNIEDLYHTLFIAWVDVHGIEDQKEFAITLMKHKHPLQSILFSMKKRGDIADGNLEKEFRSHPELIIKVLAQ